MKIPRVPNKAFYTAHASEFEIQAELYLRLKNLCLNVRGCVPGWCDDNGMHRVFLDLAIFDDDNELVLIIECKNGKAQKMSDQSRQKRRYSMLGVPLIFCPNYESIEDTIRAVKNSL